jgi:hypothetical protein
MDMREAVSRIVAPATLRSTSLRASRRRANHHDQQEKSSTHKPLDALLVALIVATVLSGAPSTAHAAKQSCASKLSACYKICDRYSEGQFKRSCDSRCRVSFDRCLALTDNLPTGNAGVQDTGGTGKPPKAGNSTSPGGRVATDPKSPPKGAGGTRAPLSGGVFSQPSTTGSGGNGPILKSGGSKR